MAATALTGDDTRPFVGIRVLDLTHVLAGPFCTYQLALLGADTIKVEDPSNPDIVRESGPDLAHNRRGMGTSFLTQNSNKRCLTLNLKDQRARDVLRRLARDADVLVENYRSGALSELGLGYEQLKAINPRLIYCSMTGYGQDGPKGKHNSYDPVIQGMSGLMSTTGTSADSPLKTGAPVIDYASGLSGAFAVSCALFQRERTGRGQHIDCSMLDAALTMMSSLITSYLFAGHVPVPRENDLDQAGVSGYRAKDGVWLMLGAFNARQNRRLWMSFDRPDLASFGTLELQELHRDEIAATLRQIIATKNAAEWETYFDDIGVPAGRARNLAEALALPQVRHRRFVHEFRAAPGIDHVFAVPTAAFHYLHGGPRVDSPPRSLGADTDSILMELGLEAGTIAEYRRDGVV
jgi:crotonobetainyl-CoA:carnitine CoA-transferase CaiB-like acyl-CoA transferase